MQPIATIKKTKEIQEKYNVFTKKTYGQNFIIEPKVVEKIAQAAIKDPNENNPVISIIALSALLYSLFAKLEIIPKNAFTAELRNQLTAKPVTRHIILRIVVKNLLNNPLHFGIAVFNRKSKDFLNPNFL